jgi:mevalonate kinase
MWIITKLLQSKAARVVAFVLSLALSVFAYGKAQRSKGAAAIKEELIQEDLQNAIRIREEMDKAKRDAIRMARDAKYESVLNELRKRDKLRD